MVTRGMMLGLLAVTTAAAEPGEAKGKTLFRERTTEYQSAIATRTRNDDGFHLLTVILYPWKLEKDELEKMSREIPVREMPELAAKHGLEEKDHYFAINFQLKDAEKDFGPENIEKFSLSFRGFKGGNSSLSWGSDEAMAQAGVKLENFTVDTLERGGTVSFEFKCRNVRKNHGGGSDEVTAVAAKVEAFIVSSWRFGKNVGTPPAP